MERELFVMEESRVEVGRRDVRDVIQVAEVPEVVQDICPIRLKHCWTGTPYAPNHYRFFRRNLTPQRSQATVYVGSSNDGDIVESQSLSSTSTLFISEPDETS